MNRQEFTKVLSECRKQNGMLVKELCFKLQCMSSDLYKFENAKHNYNMQKCFEYLNAIDTKLAISTAEGNNIVFEDYAALLKFVVDTRIAQGYSQRRLASEIGCAYVTIAYFEKQKTVMTIDTFLKIADALKLTVDISPKTA